MSAPPSSDVQDWTQSAPPRSGAAGSRAAGSTAETRIRPADGPMGSGPAGVADGGDGMEPPRPEKLTLRERASRLWTARIRPVLTVITPVGWALLAAAILCWIIGVRWDVIELNALALAMTIPLVVAVVFVLGRTRYEVTLGLASHRVVVGAQAVGRILVRNPVQRSIMPSRIELTVGAATAQFLVPRLAPEAEHEEMFTVPTARRAVLEIGPVRSVRDDPLSLVRRQVVWAPAQEVFVHPRTVRLDEAASGYLRDLEGNPSMHLSSSDISFHALREYSPGDDLRHVHWRTTARTGTLMVRQFEETRRSHVVVGLDNRADQYATEEEFEMAVSAAASIAAQTFREEKTLTALTLDAEQRTGAYRALMDDYTVIDPITGRWTLQELGQRAADEAPNASAVMLVVGSQAGPRELHSAALRLPLGVIAVAVRCEEGADVHRSALGDLHLVTIGALEDLPRALRSVA